MLAEKHTTPALYNNGIVELIDSPQLKTIVDNLLQALNKTNIAYRCRVRNPEKIQVVKIRSIMTSSELFFTVPHLEHKNIILRFYQYVDRFKTTSVVRQVVRQVNFDLTKSSIDEVVKLIQNEGVAWLMPTSKNLKPPQVKLYTIHPNQGEPKSYLPVGFEIKRVKVLSSGSTTELEVYSADDKIYRRVPYSKVSTRLGMNLEDFIGRYFVDFHNQDFLILSEPIFNQQFELIG